MGICCPNSELALQEIQTPKKNLQIYPINIIANRKQIKEKKDNKIQNKILVAPLLLLKNTLVRKQQNSLYKNQDYDSRYYNQKIDNTVRDSELSSQKHNLSFTQDFNRKGLPNIGNTCFLNCVIQMLFSASKIRNTIQQLSNQNFHFKMHNLLSKIFTDINQNGQTSKKRQNLLKLSFKLQQKTPHLIYKNQQDFLDCFLNIIGFLQQENSKVSNFLTFRLNQICKCNKNSNAVQKIIMNSQSFCALCNQNMKIIIDNPSPYMLFVLNYNRPQFKKTISFVNKSGRKLFYKVIAYIIYSGNQQNGHYYVCRQNQFGHWLSISDQKVQLCQDYDKPKNMPMICLYKYQQYHR